MKLGEMLAKHRNTFLLTLLTATLIVSGLSRREMEEAIPTVQIPVTETKAQALSPMEAYRTARDQQAREDLDALKSLCEADRVDRATREAAAKRLTELAANREAESALEGALCTSGLYPCVAVVAGGSVTIVTGKNSISERDSALVLTLCAAHAGVFPENIRIVTAE